MRARMITSLAGPEGLALPGQVIDGPDARVKELIEGGYAVALGPKDVETATACSLRETATAPAAIREAKGKGKSKAEAAEAGG